jgi:hypothetical protein
MLPLQVAAERTAISTLKIGRWCATGLIRCERDGEDWMVPVSELETIVRVAAEHARAIEDAHVKAVVIPEARAVPDLAEQIGQRLGLQSGQVSVAPMAIDGVDYVVAIWPGTTAGTGGLPALRELVVDLDADLLDGEVKSE